MVTVELNPVWGKHNNQSADNRGYQSMLSILRDETVAEKRQRQIIKLFLCIIHIQVAVDTAKTVWRHKHKQMS